MFRIILLSSVILLSACGSRHGVISSNMSVNTDSTYTSNRPGTAFVKLIEAIVWRMPERASEKHTKSVYFAINNLKDGEKITWIDEPSATSGSIKILMTTNISGGYCRLINSHVNYEDKSRNLSEYACSTTGGERWYFRPLRT